MRFIPWPIRWILILIETPNKLKEVDRETERIREIQGNTMAYMHKQRVRRPLETRLMWCIAKVIITVSILAYVIFQAALK
jgi:hypothetical protein